MSALSDGVRPRLAPNTQAAAVDGEEPLRYVLRRPDRPASCCRLGDVPAALVFRLDGSRDIDDVVEDAGRRFGKDAPALLVRLLAELGDRGFLHGVAGIDADERRPLGPIAQLFRSRTWRWRRAPDAIERIYRSGGWMFVTVPAVIALCAVALAGLAALVLLLARGSMTPFVVSGRLGLGAACFLGGRAILVALHELAHGMALARTGHRVAGAGIKLMAIFPYAFVDTSPVWLEPRRQRMRVTAAGPFSDLTLGGAAAIAALLTHGWVSDVCYQLCLAGYLAALLNLNPCLERDGYHLLCDAIRRPGLRVAALTDLYSRLSGRGARDRARPLLWYSCAVVVWGVAGAALAVASLSRALPSIQAAVPHDVSKALLGALWLVLLAPTALLVGRPLAMRTARSEPEPPNGIQLRPSPLRMYRRDSPQLREGGSSPIAILARQVLHDASLRQRVRSLGQPPGFEALGDRELKSSVAGVVLAAGGESLALAHTAGVLGPPIEHFATSAIHNTNLSELRNLLGLDQSSPPEVVPHLEPNFASVPHVPSTTPIVYEPPAAATRGLVGEHLGRHERGVRNLLASLPQPTASSAAALSDQWLATGGYALPPWPGNDAGDVAIAHWMAEGAAAAGLPGELPVMAALTESGLNNNACCDHDSLGYFQMRMSLWNHGPYAGYYENPVLQLRWFIHEATLVRDEIRAGGDPTFGDDPSTWGNWIADIEKPAAEYRYRYQLHLPDAETLLSQPAPLPGASTVFASGLTSSQSVNTTVEPSGAYGELINTPSGQSFRTLLDQLNSPGGSGVYVPPFNVADAVMGRTDQGVDADLHPGDQIVAIGNSKVVGINPDWFEGQPYIWMQLLDGPQAGRYWYVAEQITPLVHTGDIVGVGQPVATYAPSGTGIEMGWSTVDGTTLARAMAEGTLSSSALDGLPSDSTAAPGVSATPGVVITPGTSTAAVPAASDTGATGATGTTGTTGTGGTGGTGGGPASTTPTAAGPSNEPTFAAKAPPPAPSDGEPTFVVR